jgi:hypothetical protein
MHKHILEMAEMKHYNPEEDVIAFMREQIARIARTLNIIVIGGTFMLLIVFLDYLVDMG